ncbi:MAG: hypothetical protein ACYTEL_08450 [Planctomycetota bacterium]|jgi:hypothetical protein
MATQAQINANRRNAQKSTGPRTPNGKAVVARNAVKHGLRARRHALISSDSPQEFEIHRDRIIAALNPANPVEHMLAERIVGLAWRLKRAASFQNQVIDAMHVDHTAKTRAELRRLLYGKEDHKEEDLLKRKFKLKPDPAASAPDLALGYIAIRDFKNAGVFDRLLTYERRIEQSLYKALLELHKLRRRTNRPDNDSTHQQDHQLKLPDNP